MINRVVAPLTDIERVAFIAAARSFLGVRFRHQGRSREGIDCGGLVGESLRAVGRDPYDIIGYSREPYRGGLEEVLDRNFGPMLEPAEIQPGDIALMRFHDGQPSHVAIVEAHPYGGLMLIHSFARVKKVVEHRLDDEWLGYITGVYRP